MRAGAVRTREARGADASPIIFDGWGDGIQAMASIELFRVCNSLISSHIFCAPGSMGIIKAGRVVVLLQGRYAGRKAVVVKAYETGDGDRKFSHAIVAGLERGPRKITKGMDEKKIAKRSLMKPFIKHVNYTHMMPTRYQCFDDKKEDGGVLKKIIDEAVKSKAKFTSKEVRGAVRKLFMEKFTGQATAKYNEKKATGVQYFYSKLRF